MNSFRFVRYSALCALTLLSLSACKLTSTSLPAISDSGVARTGQVVWHDLVTPDLAGSQAFYAQVFGWQFTTIGDEYLLISKDGITLGGMAELNTRGRNSHWLGLISVTDIDSAIKHTQTAGGKVLVDKTYIDGRGDVAVLQDPQGAVFALITAVKGDPAMLSAKNDQWLWQEVWSDDPSTSQAFYRQLASYQADQKSINGHDYAFFRTGDQAAFGFVKKSDPQIGNTWVNYIKVENVNAAVAKVTQAGGTILMAPSVDIRQGTVAIISDPFGAGLVLQEMAK